MNCLTKLRGFRARDAAALFALPFVVGLPFVWMQYYWFGPSDRLLFLLTSHFRLSADALTVVMSGIYLVLFGLMQLTGYRFLRRFLGPLNKAAE